MTMTETGSKTQEELDAMHSCCRWFCKDSAVFKRGDKVFHTEIGIGTVVSVGFYKSVKVKFKNYATKVTFFKDIIGKDILNLKTLDFE